MNSSIFSYLSAEQSVLAYKMLVNCILATDMSKHLELCLHFEQQCFGGGGHGNQAGEFPEFEQRLLLMQMIMKAADISNISKPFPVARQWALAVTEEFCSQGDKEKGKNLQVQEMFDREKMVLGNVQVGFIDGVGLKFWRLLHEAVPSLDEFVQNIYDNRTLWAELSQAD
eukprot:NODE_2884_length_850_cov_41.016230_g2386_i0.p1 GENE.NODE_2884_length_850_cov_41.016230_g2386_i0~~NODE_2884_length_850_cov_41.016230_g2386_i0.p1  ORF type:complete len:170 (+),score=49.10 NODE_2884_length_850_cov_41.016230_g2386_i0:254-763(+)